MVLPCTSRCLTCTSARDHGAWCNTRCTHPAVRGAPTCTSRRAALLIPPSLCLPHTAAQVSRSSITRPTHHTTHHTPHTTPQHTPHHKPHTTHDGTHHTRWHTTPHPTTHSHEHPARAATPRPLHTYATSFQLQHRRLGNSGYRCSLAQSHTYVRLVRADMSAGSDPLSRFM